MSGEACKFSVDVCRPPNSWHRSLKYQGSRERPHPRSTDLRTAEEDGWPQSQRPVAVGLRAAAAAAVGGCGHRPSAGAWSHRPGQWGSCGREEGRPPDFPCLVARVDLPSQLQRPCRRGYQRGV
ncbi:hypothetical protein U0070_016041 [Myodes glareolus]|uniref:Uncharacterized protein n=1 Tax=Myodes glareolus TaxID=447135 RepID=A0AAW0I9P3_MYOGA